MQTIDDQTTGEPRGLTVAEAARRLSADGPNTLPDPERRGPLRIVAEVLREPMFALLIAGGLVYLALGDPKEALLLLAFALMSVGTTVVQELRSEKVLEALRDLTSPRALVIRDGEPVRIAGAEVVSGDLLAVAEGDRIPANSTLLRGAELQADESLLTGESAPVDKHPAPVGERTAASTLYSGTVVVRGEGMAEVAATGPRTEIGKIGQSLRSLGRETPRLSREVRRLVRAVAVLAFAASTTMVVITGLVRGSWLKGLLGGVALGMSLIPQEFPMVLTVFMVMGAWRISRSRVLTRRAEAIETLGSATVLCTDKTGTLTQNRMTLTAAWCEARAFDLRFARYARHGVGRRGGLEADGEEDDLAVGIAARDRERVERRIDDADVAAARLGGEQVGFAAGHAQHVAEGAEDHLGPAGDLDRLVDVVDRRHADRAARPVDQRDLGGSSSSMP